VIYDKTHFDAKGVAEPKTAQETLDAAIKLTDAPKVFGWGMPVDPSNVEYFAQAIQKFASFFNSAISLDGKIVVNQPSFVEGITWYKKFFDADVTPKSIDWRTQRKMNAQGKVVMITDGPYHFDIADSITPGFSKNLVAIRPPFPGDFVLYGSNFISINKSSKIKEQAATFLKWWLSDEFQTEFNMYGKHIGAVKVEYPADFMQKNPYMKAFGDPSLKPLPALVIGHEERSMEIRTMMVNFVADILYKNAPIQQTLDKAQKAIEDALK
jgi:ABC-type glycerol-3-phosphate transport system substrate-binding protein